MHPLNDVSAIVENSLDVFCIYSAGKVWIAVVFAITTRCRYTQKLIPYKIFRPNHFRVFSHLANSIGWCLVTIEFAKVVGQFALAGLDLLRQ